MVYYQKITSHINNLIRFKVPLNSYGFVGEPIITAPEGSVFLLLSVQHEDVQKPQPVSFCYRRRLGSDATVVKIKILFECQEVWVLVDSDSIDLI